MKSKIVTSKVHVVDWKMEWMVTSSCGGGGG